MLKIFYQYIKKNKVKNGYIKRTIAKKFDKKFYLKQYPDVAKSKINPLEHFLNYGWKEGRWPRSDFDTSFYMNNNPDVVESGINPYFHYLIFGKAEGRSTGVATVATEEVFR